jgi:hypothetical protein
LFGVLFALAEGVDALVAKATLAQLFFNLHEGLTYCPCCGCEHTPVQEVLFAVTHDGCFWGNQHIQRLGVVVVVILRDGHQTSFYDFMRIIPAQLLMQLLTVLLLRFHVWGLTGGRLALTCWLSRKRPAEKKL